MGDVGDCMQGSAPKSPPPDVAAVMSQRRHWPSRLPAAHQTFPVSSLDAAHRQVTPLCEGCTASESPRCFCRLRRRLPVRAVRIGKRCLQCASSRSMMVATVRLVCVPIRTSHHQRAIPPACILWVAFICVRKQKIVQKYSLQMICKRHRLDYQPLPMHATSMNRVPHESAAAGSSALSLQQQTSLPCPSASCHTARAASIPA